MALIFGLGIVSCQKQVIKPCSERSHEVPEWNYSKLVSDDGVINEDHIDGDSSIDDVDITDPNDDPDGLGR